ncbi:hypothetical protein FGB62_130g137 [Gracilaria domingensis]|nr:hypothetical protein FGB62_130g137 [Gracilaria domingensis]
MHAGLLSVPSALELWSPSIPSIYLNYLEASDSLANQVAKFTSLCSDAPQEGELSESVYSPDHQEIDIGE